MTGLNSDERAELARLRAEVAALQARSWRGRAAARWTLAVVLLVLASVVAMASLVGAFVRTELLDTGRYLDTVAPLARDPVVQQAIADRVTDELVTRLELAQLLQQLIDALAERGAHDELDAVLTTGEGRFLSVEGDTLLLNLGGIIAEVKQRLVDAGLTLVERLPDFSVTVPLVASNDIPKVQRWVRLLNAAAWILPLAMLALLAGGVAAVDQTAALIARLQPPLGGVPAAAGRYRHAIEVGLVVLAVAVLVSWRRTGISGTLWLTAGLLLAVAVVELLSRIATAPAGRPATVRPS